MKAHAGLRQAVDIWGAYFGVSIASEHVSAEILGYDEDNVGTIRNRMLTSSG